MSPKIAVVGAGPAGLTAARRLAAAGHDVVVLETEPHVGGRTHTARFGEGHHLDTGAGWLTSAYTRTLQLLDELGERDRLRPLRATGPAELVVDGERYTGPLAPRTAGGASLVGDDEAARLGDWFRSLAGYPKDLSWRLEHDDETAAAHVTAAVGAAANAFVFGPMFDGLFAPLADQSAEFLRSWAAAGAATYWQVDGGMDAIWRRVASELDVRTGTRVEDVRPCSAGLEIETTDGKLAADGAVVAVPPPIGRTFVPSGLVPDWYGAISYAGQCRVYAAARDAESAPAHVRPVPMDLLASVERQSGRHGAWGSCPDDLVWCLVCADQAHNDELLRTPDDDLASRLWTAARSLIPDLFDLADASVVHVVRWRCAVPTMAPGHLTRVAAYERTPPVVLAGDWTHQACVEGAVRSGEAAAAAF